MTSRLRRTPFAGRSETPATAVAASSDAVTATPALDMEPDLRALAGVLAACRSFGAGFDPVEPLVLAVLADHGDAALDRLVAGWRQLIERDDTSVGEQR
jgi:hypothetical protein